MCMYTHTQILRAESSWTKETAGGIRENYGKNPQLLIKVHRQTDITISMNQPDQRMKYKHMGANGKAHFEFVCVCVCVGEGAVGVCVCV